MNEYVRLESEPGDAEVATDSDARERTIIVLRLSVVVGVLPACGDDSGEFAERCSCAAPPPVVVDVGTLTIDGELVELTAFESGGTSWGNKWIINHSSHCSRDTFVLYLHGAHELIVEIDFPSGQLPTTVTADERWFVCGDEQRELEVLLDGARATFREGAIRVEGDEAAVANYEVTYVGLAFDSVVVTSDQPHTIDGEVSIPATAVIRNRFEP